MGTTSNCTRCHSSALDRRPLMTVYTPPRRPWQWNQFKEIHILAVDPLESTLSTASTHSFINTASIAAARQASSHIYDDKADRGVGVVYHCLEQQPQLHRARRPRRARHSSLYCFSVSFRYLPGPPLRLLPRLRAGDRSPQPLAVSGAGSAPPRLRREESPRRDSSRRPRCL